MVGADPTRGTEQVQPVAKPALVSCNGLWAALGFEGTVVPPVGEKLADTVSNSLRTGNGIAPKILGPVGIEHDESGEVISVGQHESSRWRYLEDVRERSGYDVMPAFKRK